MSSPQCLYTVQQRRVGQCYCSMYTIFIFQVFQNVSFPFRPFSSKEKQEKNERKKEILIIFHLEKQIGLERNDISYGVKYTCCHLTSYVKQTQLKLSRIFFPCRGRTRFFHMRDHKRLIFCLRKVRHITE